MSSNIVGASIPNKIPQNNRESIKLALKLRIHFESDISKYTDSGVDWCFSEKVNPAFEPITKSFSIKEKDCFVKMPIYENKKGFANSIKNVVKVGEQCILSELIRNDISELKIHIYIYGINVGDAVSHLFSSANGNAGLIMIQQLFYNNKIVQNKKVSYCKVDFIGSYDKYNEIRKYYASGKTLSSAESFPTKQDVKDAALLCQYTYDCQLPIDKSVVDVVLTINKGVKMVTGQLTDKEKNELKQERSDRAIVMNEFRKSSYREVDKKDALFIALEKNGFQSYLNGFYSKLYVKEVNSRKFYAYCTCGTNMFSVLDWFGTNIPQGLIGLSPQYTQSVQNAQILDALVGSDFLFFIGHSLGGGLASNNSIVTGRPAITFNAAGLSPLRLAVTGKSTLKTQIAALWHIKDNIKVNRAKGERLVHAYVTNGEMLNGMLSHIMDEGAIGKKHDIELSDKSLGPKDKHALIHLIRKNDNNEVFGAIEEYFENN